MEKKESPKKPVDFKAKPEFGSPAKAARIPNAIFDIIKLALGLSLLPFVYSLSAVFLEQIANIEFSLQRSFWAGVVAFVLIYLFIWEPVAVYNKGQRLMEIIFSFFQPLLKVAPYLLPIYTILLFILYAFLSLFIKYKWFIDGMMFLFGLSIALHLIFSDKSIRAKKGDLLKSNYIFGFSFIYIINIALISLCLNFMLKEFSFVNFCNEAYSIASSIFSVIFSQLFKVKP